jgi:hypothetical protein
VTQVRPGGFGTEWGLSFGLRYAGNELGLVLEDRSLLAAKQPGAVILTGLGV